MASLPVLALADEIARSLTDGNVLLRAEPGAGKSTGLPLALLDQATPQRRIVLLEPRRLAARSVAERLAHHLREPLGQRIGLRMRSDTRVSAQTCLEVVTEGVLTRLLQRDPSLEGVWLVVFDEFHERSLHADLGLALCLEVQQALREDLRLLLMSATLQAESIAERVNAVCSLDCPVQQHAVQTIWEGDSRSPLAPRIVQSIHRALESHPGDVLVFLPGVAEIGATSRLLQGRLPADCELHVLHGGVGANAQRRATALASAGIRRVILATSLAETSITIDGVRVVVDAGLERRARQDSRTGALRLETVSASQASADQRRGRAGRTSSGWCYRLWSEEAHVRRPEHWQAEILRADLGSLVLETGLWGAGDVQDLPWLEPPPEAGLSQARDLLQRLGLWADGRPTEQGRQVAALPVSPRIGSMLLWAAEHAVLETALTLAVLLDEGSRHVPGVDLEPMLHQALNRELAQRRTALGRLTDRLSTRSAGQAGDPDPSADMVLARAFPDWIAQRRDGHPGRFQLASGAGVTLDEQSPLAHSSWLVVAQLGGGASELRIFRAMALDIDALREWAPELFKSERQVSWDDRQERVLAESRVMLGRLVVQVQALSGINEEERADALLQGVRLRGLSCLPWDDDCREWQARVMRLRELDVPKGVRPFPCVDDDSLLESLDQWLRRYLSGMGTLKALRQLDLLSILSSRLDYPQQQLLENWLPRRYTVPSGSRIRLSYLAPGNPVLSVRLQEMLGCTSNPSIAEGRIRLKVQLLSPAQRPVQITEDLVDFWHGSYAEVRKEMAGRYPKHLWPDDPMSALPTTRAKPRGSRKGD